MKTIVKELLDEMLSITIFSKKILLKKAYEEMGISDANDVSSKLLFWQKAIYNPTLPKSKYRKEDKFLLEKGPIQERFNTFFEHCPIINELFVLEGHEVHYNSNLTKAEILEMQEYIDEHYKVPFHTKGFGTKYI